MLDKAGNHTDEYDLEDSAERINRQIDSLLRSAKAEADMGNLRLAESFRRAAANLGKNPK